MGWDRKPGRRGCGPARGPLGRHCALLAAFIETGNAAGPDRDDYVVWERCAPTPAAGAGTTLFKVSNSRRDRWAARPGACLEGHCARAPHAPQAALTAPPKKMGSGRRPPLSRVVGSGERERIKPGLAGRSFHLGQIAPAGCVWWGLGGTSSRGTHGRRLVATAPTAVRFCDQAPHARQNSDAPRGSDARTQSKGSLV